jgi:biopolymer transport protein ExbD
MKFPRNAQIFRGQLDASPFVGVLFLLTMFLLLHSTLVSTPGVSIDLPTGPGELPGSANEEVMIAVDQNGRLFLQNQLTEESHLKEQLAKLRAKPVSVVLLADKSVPYETLMRLLSVVREAGVSGEVTLATRSPARPAAGSPRP